MLKILQVRLQQYVNSDLPDVHLVLEKAEEPEINLPTNLENSAVATGLEKVSFHSSPKERQCQRMLQLLHNCTHLMGSHRVGHD